VKIYRAIVPQKKTAPFGEGAADFTNNWLAGRGRTESIAYFRPALQGLTRSQSEKRALHNEKTNEPMPKPWAELPHPTFLFGG